MILKDVLYVLTGGTRGDSGESRAVAEKMAMLEMQELNERQRADLAVLRQRQSQARAMGI